MTSQVSARIQHRLSEGNDGFRSACVRFKRGPDARREETWEQWWQAVAVDPSLAGEVAERDRRAVHHHGPEGALLAVHAEALRAAGFAEVGTLCSQKSGPYGSTREPHPGRRALAAASQKVVFTLSRQTRSSQR